MKVKDSLWCSMRSLVWPPEYYFQAFHLTSDSKYRVRPISLIQNDSIFLAYYMRHIIPGIYQEKYCQGVDDALSTNRLHWKTEQSEVVRWVPLYLLPYMNIPIFSKVQNNLISKPFILNWNGTFWLLQFLDVRFITQHFFISRLSTFHRK